MLDGGRRGQLDEALVKDLAMARRRISNGWPAPAAKMDEPLRPQPRSVCQGRSDGDAFTSMKAAARFQQQRHLCSGCLKVAEA